MGKFNDVDWTDESLSFRVSYSGGKDSSAMLLMLLEKGYPVTSVDFMDVGYEYPEVYEYVDKIESFVKENYGKTINRLKLKDEWQFEPWFYGKYKTGLNEGHMRGFPRVLGRCYLSRQKGRTLDRYDRSSYRYIGIGWNEKHRESTEPLLLYPLIEWQVTEDECIDYLAEKNLLPGHKRYYRRSGCWWCPKQSVKSSISLYIRHPELWEKLKQYEVESPHGWNLPGRETNDVEERVKKEILSGKIDLLYYLDDKTEKEVEETLKRIMGE